MAQDLATFRRRQHARRRRGSGILRQLVWLAVGLIPTALLAWRIETLVGELQRPVSAADGPSGVQEVEISPTAGGRVWGD